VCAQGPRVEVRSHWRGGKPKVGSILKKKGVTFCHSGGESPGGHECHGPNREAKLSRGEAGGMTDKGGA